MIQSSSRLPQAPQSQSFDRKESHHHGYPLFVTPFNFNDDDDDDDVHHTNNDDPMQHDGDDLRPLLINNDTSNPSDSDSSDQDSYISHFHHKYGKNHHKVNHLKTSPQPSSFLHDNMSNIIILLSIFTVAFTALSIMYIYMPDLDPQDRPFIKLPRSFDDVKKLSDILEKYKHDHLFYVTWMFASVYITLQTFAIPGAVFLSILAGPLYGIIPGILIISTVATIGSSLCFLLSRTFGAPLVHYFFPNQLATFQDKINENRDSLFFYLLFLRVAPVLPNWLINIASPVLHIDYLSFACATFIGVMPNNYLMTTVGLSLQSITDPGPLITPKSFISLTLIGLVALLPLWLKGKMTKEASSPSPSSSSSSPSFAPQSQLSTDLPSGLIE